MTLTVGELADLYRSYNPAVGDVENFIFHALDNWPVGCCGIASVLIRERMGGRVVNGLYDGTPHTFVLLDDETVLDMTADQFGGPPLYCGPLAPPWSLRS